MNTIDNQCTYLAVNSIPKMTCKLHGPDHLILSCSHLEQCQAEPQPPMKSGGQARMATICSTEKVLGWFYAFSTLQAGSFKDWTDSSHLESGNLLHGDCTLVLGTGYAEAGG